MIENYSTIHTFKIQFLEILIFESIHMNRPKSRKNDIDKSIKI